MLTVDQVRRIRHATGCSIAAFCRCFPIRENDMRAYEATRGVKPRLVSERDEAYLRRIAIQWHVDLSK